MFTAKRLSQIQMKVNQLRQRNSKAYRYEVTKLPGESKEDAIRRYKQENNLQLNEYDVHIFILS